MERLVRMEDSQYSYRNTLLATNSEGITAGIIVSYDGAQLKALRKRFIEEAKETFGIDYTGMDPGNAGGRTLYRQPRRACCLPWQGYRQDAAQGGDRKREGKWAFLPWDCSWIRAIRRQKTLCQYGI